MDILFSVLITFLLLFSMVFAVLPGSFGLLNYKKNVVNSKQILATVFYHSVWIMHIVAVINLWSKTVSVWWSILIPLILIVSFFLTVGRDVSTG